MQAGYIKPNFHVHIIPGTGKERKGKANNQPKKVRKYVDLCDVYGSSVQQPKQPNPPPNGYIVALLKFICSDVFTYQSCGGKLYHQGYPDALGDLIVVLKTKRVFVNPATHERTRSNKFSNVYFYFKFACFLHMITALHLNLSKQNKTLKCVLLNCVLKRCMLSH